MTHQGCQNTLKVHGGGALGHAQDEDVGPGVADEGDLSLVTMNSKKDIFLILTSKTDFEISSHPIEFLILLSWSGKIYSGR